MFWRHFWLIGATGIPHDPYDANDWPCPSDQLMLIEFGASLPLSWNDANMHDNNIPNRAG